MKDVFLTVLFCMIASIAVITFFPFLVNLFTVMNLRGFFDLTIFFLLIVILKILLDIRKNHKESD